MSTTSDMLDVATDYCKKLFGFEPKPNIHLGDHFWSKNE